MHATLNARARCLSSQSRQWHVYIYTFTYIYVYRAITREREARLQEAFYLQPEKANEYAVAVAMVVLVATPFFSLHV